MPDEIKGGVADPKEHNEKVAEQLKQQDITNQPSDLQGASDALDALVEVKKKEKEEAPDPTETQTPPAKTEAELAVEKKAKEEADAKAAEVETAKKRADEIFKDTPGLPPGASPKSSEAFATIKVKAAQEITARDAEIEKLRKRNEELESAVKTTKPLTPEVEKEIEELRHFRTRLDVEADPKFKQFDKTVDSAREFIYAQLKKSPAITDDVIAEIKKYGGPDAVKLEKIFEAVKDPTLQRLVESKLAEIETAKFDKENAINTARADIKKYVEEREKSISESATVHNKVTADVFGKLRTSDGLKWLAERKADEKADEATKKAVAEHNEFVKVTNQQIEAAMSDDSPEMRAILLAGMAQLLYTQRVHEQDKAKLSTIETDHKKVVDGLNAKVTELEARIAKFKGASVTRLEQSGAPSTERIPTVKSGEIDIRPTTQALDDIARDIREKRNA